MIGTGSSAIQSIPIIAQQAKHLTVFQRTANYTIPAHNRPLDPAYVREVKASYREMRKRAKTLPAGIDLRVNNVSAVETPEEERRRQYQERWDYGGLGFMASFNDLLLNDESNKTAADFVREKIREIVKDPKTAEILIADEHHRLQAAVRRQRLLGDLQPAERHAGRYPRRADRAHHAGRRARRGGRTTLRLPGARNRLRRHDRRAAQGRYPRPGRHHAREKWGEGPKTYLGLTVVGFPNLFTITGPGSPSVLTNMLPSIEQHVDWIAECLEALRAKGVAVIEPEPAGAGRLERPRRLGRQHHPALDLQLLVPRRQHPGQAAGIHALYRRPAGLYRALRGGGGERLRGVRASLGRPGGSTAIIFSFPIAVSAGRHYHRHPQFAE